MSSGLLEIWEAFFLIFYNLFMYVYYFIIFIIDKLTESEATLLLEKAPKILLIIPAACTTATLIQFRRCTETGRDCSKADCRGGGYRDEMLENSANLRKPASGGRVSIVRKLLEFFNGVFSARR